MEGLELLLSFTSFLWEGVSGSIWRMSADSSLGREFLEQSCAIYGNHFSLFVIEGCLLICCWIVEVFGLFQWKYVS